MVQVSAGELLCRVGRPATYWFGVIDGLLKMSNDTAMGIPITFTGVPPGGWFGEGTVIKREAYRYNIQALRKSVVAGLSVEAFHWLIERSIPFNRFVTQQLNERLGQFIGAREIDRMTDPDGRVARSLAALFHPVLYPGVGGLLRITQQELGYLVGLSRQRVNEALQALAGREPDRASNTAACACSTWSGCAVSAGLDPPPQRLCRCPSRGDSRGAARRLRFSEGSHRAGDVMPQPKPVPR